MDQMYAGPGRCSIASTNMDYLVPDGTINYARKGEIKMNGDEWCWVRQREKWGAKRPWTTIERHL